MNNIREFARGNYTKDTWQEIKTLIAKWRLELYLHLEAISEQKFKDQNKKCFATVP